MSEGRALAADRPCGTGGQQYAGRKGTHKESSLQTGENDLLEGQRPRWNLKQVVLGDGSELGPCLYGVHHT
jgi:hypothetical protein